jgi:hypothetical protein
MPVDRKVYCLPIFAGLGGDDTRQGAYGIVVHDVDETSLPFQPGSQFRSVGFFMEYGERCCDILRRGCEKVIAIT